MSYKCSRPPHFIGKFAKALTCEPCDACYLGGIYWGNKDYGRAADEFEAYLKFAPKAPDAEQLRAYIKELRSKQ